jgi:GNAT superfamily N-acetyltransferase
MPAPEIPAVPERSDAFVSSSPELIDLDTVCALLAASYWARDRTRRVIEASLGSSLCFGLYERDGGRQVGFARVVTDGATFSWLCDVAIAESHRGRGLGKFLVASVMAHPVVRATNVILGTRDAHGLYEQFGFRRAEMMRRPVQGNGPEEPPSRG